MREEGSLALPEAELVECCDKVYYAAEDGEIEEKESEPVRKGGKAKDGKMRDVVSILPATGQGSRRVRCRIVTILYD